MHEFYFSEHVLKEYEVHMSLMPNCIMCGNNPIVEHNHCEICLRQKAAKLKKLSKKIEETKATGDQSKVQELVTHYNTIAESIGLRPI